MSLRGIVNLLSVLTASSPLVVYRTTCVRYPYHSGSQLEHCTSLVINAPMMHAWLGTWLRPSVRSYLCFLLEYMVPRNGHMSVNPSASHHCCFLVLQWRDSCCLVWIRAACLVAAHHLSCMSAVDYCSRISAHVHPQ